MKDTDANVVDTLNQLFKEDKNKYSEYTKVCKQAGYKIFRNSFGEHKVAYNHNYIYEAFGGIFGGLK